MCTLLATCSRQWTCAVAAALLGFTACASTPPGHGPDRPVSWSLSVGEKVVCATGMATPCEVPRSTGERTVFATFTVHVQSPVPRNFKGTLAVGFLADNAARSDAPINLFSKGPDVHTSLNGRVTTEPGAYTARVSVEETGGDLKKPIQHEFTVPVTVR